MIGASRTGLTALAFAVALTIGRLAAAGDAGPPPADAVPPAGDVQQGRALYADHCSHCHGFGMVNAGNVVPDLREFPPDEKQRFIDTVTHGRNNRMPPWGDVLSRKEVGELWAYVRTGGK